MWRFTRDDVQAFINRDQPSQPREPTPAAPIAPAARLHAERKAEVKRRIDALAAEGYSNQEIANRLNAERVPTLSDKGQWHKGTVGHLRQE